MVLMVFLIRRWYCILNSSTVLTSGLTSACLVISTNHSSLVEQWIVESEPLSVHSSVPPSEHLWDGGGGANMTHPPTVNVSKKESNTYCQLSCKHFYIIRAAFRGVGGAFAPFGDLLPPPLQICCPPSQICCLRKLVSQHIH